MSDQTATDQTVRCDRCAHRYPAAEGGCPRCRSIRRTNSVIVALLVMLVILTIVGWIGTLVLT
ncbi:hypothetical protein SAMN02982917_5362 [Azospirillum oryzae]|uniref:DUF2116 family Zn-ribbon domain-containing protein n=1 Tax=Azospirillum oryzae TaxID=286727 RepID=A0A1X7H9Y0_9PROT|nr:hypothetical protein [Azospirillum oryzae]SMF82479.1 hypothetical protein SAMN02982917_5362 [Azospirillum oryzae]